MANRTKRTQKRVTAFLIALAKGHSPGGAAKIAGVGRTTVYEWREADAEFANQWEKAIEEGTDYVEDEALRRAVDGVTKPIFYKGQQVATVQEFSDTLMLAILKARRPEKYRERSEVQHSGVGGRPLFEEIADALKKQYG